MPATGPTGPGVWCSDASTGSLHRLAREPFDWVGIDLQHGRYGRTELLDAARGWDHQAARLVVRVPSVEFTAIGSALDAGADVVVVPQVDSAGDARAAVDAAFYPPVGRRSAGQLQPTWGAPARDVATSNDEICCAVMIESAAALAAVEEIAAVPGVGMLFVGPNDLSLSLGTTVSDLLADATAGSPLDRIVRAARGHGVQVGAYGGEPQLGRQFTDRGFGFVAVATDGWLLSEGARAALA